MDAMTPTELRDLADDPDVISYAAAALRRAADTIEALQRREAEWDGYDEMHATLTAKIAEKDAEIERLKIREACEIESRDFYAEERDAARAEVARLNGTMPAEVEKKLRAEIERLRGALELVADLSDGYVCDPASAALEAIGDARAEVERWKDHTRAVLYWADPNEQVCKDARKALEER